MTLTRTDARDALTAAASIPYDHCGSRAPKARVFQPGTGDSMGHSLSGALPGAAMNEPAQPRGAPE